MLTPIYYLSLVLLSVFYAWRFAKVTIDPDQAMYLFESMGVGWYGKDYTDCKSPGIHLLYWFISKFTGKNIERILFVYHILINSVGIVVFAMSGNIYTAVAYIVLVNSGWLWGFHGNLSQLPAALITIGLLSGNGFLYSLLMTLSVGFEPKLIASLIGSGYLWIVFVPVAVVSALFLKRYLPDVWEWLVEAIIVVPDRIHKQRKIINPPFMSWVTARGYVYLMPWLLFAVISKPDFVYWLPVILQLAIFHYGMAVRPYHLIVVVPWIVCAGIDPTIIIVLVLSDFISAGAYIGDLWGRFYEGLRNSNAGAHNAGLFLRDKPGNIYVTGMHSGVYVYAQKMAVYEMVEQIEIREVTTERRKRMVELWRTNPPSYVVDSPGSIVEFKKSNYQAVAEVGDGTIIYQRRK